tara:strand:+ start:995 stop:1237 length:243 start_codon:yes stop_codon:yes gene_type:complete
MAWGDGQLLDRAQEVLGRDDVRDRFQQAAQTWFDRNGKGVDSPRQFMPPLPPPKPKTDYTPIIIGGAATILAALIVTRKK